MASHSMYTQWVVNFYPEFSDELLILPAFGSNSPSPSSKSLRKPYWITGTSYWELRMSHSDWPSPAKRTVNSLELAATFIDSGQFNLLGISKYVGISSQRCLLEFGGLRHVLRLTDDRWTSQNLFVPKRCAQEPTGLHALAIEDVSVHSESWDRDHCTYPIHPSMPRGRIRSLF